MLQPTRTKYRKAHKGRIHGHARRGESLNYGSYGLKALDSRTILRVSLMALIAISLSSLVDK